MFPQSREKLREMYFNAWQKYKKNLPLEPLEKQLVAVIQQHPDYQTVIEKPDQFIDKDYSPEMGETNPFLHMGFHLALHEQISTNRPAGITFIYQQLCKKNAAHDVEHQMIEILAESLWLAQRNNVMPNEQDYLEKLNRLLLPK